MKYQFVIQWSASSIEDYDAMIKIEELLAEKLPGGSEVDGHDAGVGEVNIFIYTNSPGEIFAIAKEILVARGLFTGVRVAYRPVGSDLYTILWPDGLRRFEVA